MQPSSIQILPAVLFTDLLYTFSGAEGYIQQRPVRMTIPGILLALEMSGQYDKELALRLQRREPEAMTDLYDRFGRLAYSVIFSVVRDPSLAGC